jgi:hypothetical protein
MKIIIFSLMAIFCSVLSFAQNIASPSGALPSQVPDISQVYLNADHTQFASIENTTYKQDYYLEALREGEHSVQDCTKFKKMKTIGIVLAAVGGCLAITGLALELAAAQDGFNDDGLTVSGAVLIGAGGLGCPNAGIPLIIIASVKSRKYCGGGRDRSYMELSTKGNSLALKF